MRAIRAAIAIRHHADGYGARVRVRPFCELRTLEAGKIRRESDYCDAAAFMKQVGLLPSQ